MLMPRSPAWAKLSPLSFKITRWYRGEKALAESLSLMKFNRRANKVFKGKATDRPAALKRSGIIAGISDFNESLTLSDLQVSG
jgi:hypothetical protein